MKILIVDLETMPMLSYHWQRWKENISLPQTVNEGYLASWAAKWYGEDTIMYDGLNNYNMEMEDEKFVAGSLWKLFHEADCIVTFNGDRFDIKVANTAFVRHGLTPPSPYKSVDLFKQIKKHFRLSSNSLKSAANFFQLEQKLDNSGWKLWIDCVHKEPTAWTKMEKYNRQDIVVTEALYERILGWLSNHPNHNMYKEESADAGYHCPNCSSTDLRNVIAVARRTSSTVLLLVTQTAEST
jgi:DNA polymerase elongation subunit (family B)